MIQVKNYGSLGFAINGTGFGVRTHVRTPNPGNYQGNSQRAKLFFWRNSMVNYTNENNRRDLGIVWLIAGLIFLISGFSGGSIFLLLGFLWLASSNGKGLTLFRDKPDNMRTLLKVTTIGLLILASAVLVVNAIP
jgi:hypothetical protein